MTLDTPTGRLAEARSVRWNPSPEELRELTSRMPNARRTVFDNYNVQTRVTSRSKASTYVVTDTPERHSDQTITRAEGARLARLQDEYIRDQEMLVVDGYIGNDPTDRVPARLYIEAANANIAGMQRWLYFDADDAGPDFEPRLTVIDTPNLAAPGYPADRIIAVDLEAGDHPGAELRLLRRVQEGRPADVEHPGVRPRRAGAARRLQGDPHAAGRADHAHRRALGDRQDHHHLHPAERLQAGAGRLRRPLPRRPGGGHRERLLRQDIQPRPRSSSPRIHGAVCKREAYLENVSQNDAGEVDFFDTTYTQNGRSVFRMEALGWHRDARELNSVDQLLILNRNENIIPGVARLNHAQAAAYFMLGETKGTSAGGKDEEGKFLRVPGTNPFFPLRHEQQGNRFLELLGSCDFEVFLMNTGWVGGPDGDDRSKKVTIPHSSAIVKAIAEGTISWEGDPDFGYEVAAVGARGRRPRDPPAAPPLRAPGTCRRVPAPGGAAPPGPPRLPAEAGRAWTPDRRRRLVRAEAASGSPARPGPAAGPAHGGCAR